MHRFAKGAAVLAALSLFAGAAAPLVFAKAKAKAEATPPALVRLENTKLGEVLADSRGYTLYWFAADHGTHLACQGKCLTIWPPLYVPASEKTPVVPKGIPGTFGMVARGKERQLTWDGHPLYTFVKDKAPGEVNGQGVKKLWWAAIVKPAATKTAKTVSAKGTKAQAKTKKGTTKAKTGGY